jgi:muramoyltetrapeptide carboxypeptidase
MSTSPIPALDRPRRLVPGDRVAVIAPSGPLEPDRLERGCALLGSWGLKVVTGPHALDRNRHLAGADEDRAADLQEAWCDPTVAAVLCARGGSGASRLLDLLDWAAIRRAGPKVFVGFSDATALHEAFATHLGIASLYGPMPATVPFGGEQPDGPSVEHLRRTLFEPERVQVLAGDGTTCVAPGRAVGVTLGGTVSLLAGSIGTPESRPAAGGIVVLEDVTEPTYKLENMITQLLRARWFDGARGIVLGSWVDCGEDAVEMVSDRLSHLGVPVLAGLPFGHGVPQLTVPLGVQAELDADRGTLTMLTPALA